jgi:hypothetical protein
LISTAISVSDINVDGWGTRAGKSVSRSSCGLDVGRGLTVINETGIISTDTNVLRFYGDSLKSGLVPAKVSDVIVTTGCVTLDGSGGDILQGGEGTDIIGGSCYPDTNLDTTVYTQRVDLVTDYLIYKGWALAGALESDVVWRIQKIIIDDVTGDVTKIFADGNTEFDNAWDDRLLYNYS